MNVWKSLYYKLHMTGIISLLKEQRCLSFLPHALRNNQLINSPFISASLSCTTTKGISDGPTKEDCSCGRSCVISEGVRSLCRGCQQEAQHMHGVRLLLPQYGGSGKPHLPALAVFDWKGTQGGDSHPRLWHQEGCQVPDQRTQGVLPAPASDVQPVHSHNLFPQPPAAALCVCEGANHCGACTQLVLCHGSRCTVPRQDDGP